MGDPVQIAQTSVLPQRIGRYRILCELGAGSMATLYLARATGLGRFERLVAIKITHDHLSRERAFVEMFMNEARIAAKIQHPNVIPVFEIDVERGRYYMVMDYVSGETLAVTLKHTWNKDRPLPVQFACQIIVSACEGLHAAHELLGTDGPLGVVHRDVAPQNLMIGYDGIVRVMDFGIAKALDTISMTKPGMMKGTIAYMAPEQVRCTPIDRRVDVFALGAILWEATVGMRLFRHKNDVTTAARVLKMQVPPPSTMRPGYPSDLERIVMKALQRDKEQRYQTAREMGDDLAKFLHQNHELVTPAVLGAFLTGVFPEQLRRRQHMEQMARAEEPPLDLGYTPVDASGDSLSVVNADEEVDLDDLEGPISFARSSSGSRVATLTMGKGVRIEQQRIPTMIVARERNNPDQRIGDRDGSTLVEGAPLAEVAGLRARKPLLAIAFAVPMLVGLFLLAAQGDGQAPEAQAEQTATKIDPPRPPAEIPMVRIKFEVKPANARISVNGAAQSGELVIARSSDHLVVEVSADGHRAHQQIITAESDRTIAITLEPIEIRPPAERSLAKVRPKPRVVPAKKKSKGLLYDGGDL